MTIAHFATSKSSKSFGISFLVRALQLWALPLVPETFVDPCVVSSTANGDLGRLVVRSVSCFG